MTEACNITLKAPEGVDMALVVGPQDGLLRLMEAAYDARFTVRGDEVTVTGGRIEVDAATALISDLFKLVRSGTVPDEAYVRHAIELLRGGAFSPAALREDVIISHRGKAIRPKTAGQKRYVDAIRANTVTFAIGPAGTGKTYLAMAMALSALRADLVSRVVLSRPVVEAGESLGFLPGTLFEKIDPYIRPLYDALFDMMERDTANALLADGTIEIAPLAFMRGRTLNDCFVILDEAQNATPEQMKMFLTRLGFGSKMVVTGDVTQLDLPGGVSGLKQVRPILEGVRDIAFCDFSGRDVVRHSLVADIVAAYERAEQAQEAGRPAPRRERQEHGSVR